MMVVNRWRRSGSISGCSIRVSMAARLLEDGDLARARVDHLSGVRDQQDVAAEHGVALARLADRRGVDAQQAAVGGRSDEVGALLPRHALDGVQDETAVDHAEHRSSKAEGGCVALASAAEQRLSRCVVEQDPSVAIAHQHRLVELRDERRETLALLLQAGLRLAHRGIHFCERARAVGRELVDRRGELTELAAVRIRQPMPGVAVDDEPRALSEPVRGLDGARECTPCEPAHRCREEDAEQDCEGDARRGEERRRFLPLAGLQVEPQDERPSGHDEQRDRRRHGHRRQPAGAWGHAPPSMSRICATRSRVANGFVT
jgi:hypothetical protein